MALVEGNSDQRGEDEAISVQIANVHLFKNNFYRLLRLWKDSPNSTWLSAGFGRRSTNKALHVRTGYQQWRRRWPDGSNLTAYSMPPLMPSPHRSATSTRACSANWRSRTRSNPSCVAPSMTPEKTGRENDIIKTPSPRFYLAQDRSALIRLRFLLRPFFA